MKEHTGKDIDTAGRRPKQAEVNDRLIRELRDVSHIMRSLYEGRGSQKRILVILGEAGGAVTQRELTGMMGIQPGSASEVISKLEAAGYIIRETNSQDKRTADIRLTEAGLAASEAIREQRARRHEDMFSCLEDGEKEQLLALLEKLSGDWMLRYRGSGGYTEGRRRRGKGGRPAKGR